MDVRGPVYNGDYSAYYSAERFTTEFSGRPFSTLPLFNSYTITDSPNNGNTAQTRTILAMALLNGSVVWPAWVDSKVLYPVWSALDSFGVSDIEGIPALLG